MNPYLLKELRQLTRSKVVSGGIVLLLFGQLLAAAVALPALLKSPDPDAVAAAGPILDGILGGILGLALGLALPVLVFARFVAENPKGRTLVELATAAPPVAVVDGKVQAGFVLAASLVAGSIPFRLLCVALRGVDWLSVLLSSGALLLVCAVELHVAVLVASSRTASVFRRWAALAAFQIVFGQFALGAAATAAMTGSGPFAATGRGAWGWLAAVASLCLLLRASASRALAPASTDRDRVPRLTLLALWAAWLAVVAWIALRRGNARPAVVWSFAFAVALAASFFAAAGSPADVPRRILAERPAARGARLRRFPVSVGFAGGVVFVAALLPATFLLGALLARADTAVPSPESADVLRALAAALYVFAVPLVVRAALRRNPVRLPLVPTVSFLALLLLQLLGAFLSVGGPALGLPFFLPGVFASETPVVGIHLVFSSLALLVGLACNADELAGSLRAYLSPPREAGSVPGASAPAPLPPPLPT